VTERELALVLMGICVGALVCLARATLRRRSLIRAEQARQQEAIAQKRAQELRQRLACATNKQEWRLDEETAFSGLFSENGFKSLTSDLFEEESQQTNKPTSPT
jgi:hypothetical protein